MRHFGTHGRVRPEQHYVVPRTAETADFINRVKTGKYIVLFAPRQTGKTTFFRLALDALVTEDPSYFPIQLDFHRYYQAGKRQLAAYIKLEAAVEGYYVVFDHRQRPEERAETEEVDGVKIRSYVIPVIQRPPSAV